MKVFVGLVIVGMCVFGGSCDAEELNAKHYLKITLSDGSAFVCNEFDISNGCKAYIDEHKLLSLENYAIQMQIPKNSIVYCTDTIYRNYKWPLNKISEIEYR